MSYVCNLRGVTSFIEYPADHPMNFYPADSRPVEVPLHVWAPGPNVASQCRSASD